MSAWPRSTRPRQPSAPLSLVDVSVYRPGLPPRAIRQNLTDFAEVPLGFEPRVRVLQTLALPLGDGTRGDLRRFHHVSHFAGYINRPGAGSRPRVVEFVDILAAERRPPA
jgi:hypothetical protein